METQKTPWRKNLDKRYISGEDLLLELKGLKKEMVVCVMEQVDAPAFDQKSQSEVIKSALWLKDLVTNQKLYKPCLLNVGRAEFLTKECGGSIYMEDWYGIPFVMYAKPDKRHGHIVAFKKYYPPQQSGANALSLLNKAQTLAELGEAWGKLTSSEKNIPTVMARKEELKSLIPS